MKKSILFLVALLLPLGVVVAQPYTKESISYIEVNGRAEKEFTPDQIFLKVTLKEGEGRSKRPLEQLEQQFFTGLEKIGLDLKEDLSISNMEITLQKYLFKKGTISAEREYIVKCNGATQVANLFELLAETKQTDVAITKVKLSDPESAVREVLKEATENAKKNGEVITTAAGEKLGRALHIQSYASYPQEIYRAPLLRSAMAIKADNNSMEEESYQLPEFKKITVTQSVTIRFEILSKE